MRGFVYFERKKRLLVIMIILAVFYCMNLPQPLWMREFAGEKVSEFLGGKFSVKIDKMTGGVFGGMVLQNVSFSPVDGKKDTIFSLERMEISYRVWWAFFEKLGILSSEQTQLKYIGMYFSQDNPFVKGFLKLSRYPEKIEIMGQISPIIFGDYAKRGIKGAFTRRGDGKYDCNLVWDGKIQITGELDPENKNIDLQFMPLLSKKGLIKISGSVDKSGELKVYSRLDKADFYGTEIIGDVWINYKDPGEPIFDIKIDNLVINKKPFWGFTFSGDFSPAKKILNLRSVTWGEAFLLKGEIGLVDDFPIDLKLIIKSLRLNEFARMLGDTKTRVFGKAEGEIAFFGPVQTAAVKGRLYIGEGVLGNMEFRSLFATLEGKLPIIRVVDSRVVKDGGNIIISGDMDFGKMKENKVFEGVTFDTDNKVAVWEDWQIEKKEKEGRVEASRERLTITTTMEEDDQFKRVGSQDPMQKELGFNYDIDTTGNSIKLDFDEDRDFLGVEHKMQF